MTMSKITMEKLVTLLVGGMESTEKVGAALMAENDMLRGEVERLNQGIVALGTNYRNHIATLEESNRKASKLLTSLTEKLTSADQTIKLMESGCLQHRQAVTKMEDELTDARMRLAELRTNLAEKDTEIANLGQSNRAYEQAVKEMNAEIENRKAQLSMIQTNHRHELSVATESAKSAKAFRRTTMADFLGMMADEIEERSSFKANELRTMSNALRSSEFSAAKCLNGSSSDAACNWASLIDHVVK